MSAASALRSPGSWASSVSAATPVSADTGSRIEQVRSGTTMPASMGGGGMMGPMAHGLPRQGPPISRIRRRNRSTAPR